MKKYTLQWLMKQKLDETRKPHPFPGKFPTRIAYSVKLFNGKGKVWTYVGKPTRQAGRFLYQLATKYPNEFFMIWAADFDRGGLISVRPNSIRTGAEWFKFGRMKGVLDAKLLRAYYFPWHLGNTTVTHFADGGVVKRVKGERRVHRVYAPPNLKLKVAEHLLPFKAWLVKEGL